MALLRVMIHSSHQTACVRRALSASSPSACRAAAVTPRRASGATGTSSTRTARGVRHSTAPLPTGPSVNRALMVLSVSTRRTASQLTTVRCTTTASAPSVSTRLSLSPTGPVQHQPTVSSIMTASASVVPMECTPTRAASASVSFAPHLTRSMRRDMRDVHVGRVVLHLV